VIQRSAALQPDPPPHRDGVDAAFSVGLARLFKKAPGVGAFLSFMGYCVMEKRNGLVVASEVNPAGGCWERAAALRMARAPRVLARRRWQLTRTTTLGSSWQMPPLPELRRMWAQNSGTHRSSAIDARTFRHQGYAQPVNARKRIEQAFSWVKQAAGLRQVKVRGRSRVGAVFRLHVVGLQPDSPGPPAQPEGGHGINRRQPADQGRISSSVREDPTECPEEPSERLLQPDEISAHKVEEAKQFRAVAKLAAISAAS